MVEISESWESLAQQAIDGNKKAYHALLKEILPYIRVRLSGTLQNVESVEDVTQEVLLSIHKSLKTYSADRPFKPWLNAIINFRRNDFLRSHYSKRGDKMSGTDNNPEFIESYVTNPAHSGESKDIEQAIGRLNKKQQRIFRLLKIEGYSTREVAEEMDMNESAVKVAAHRSAKKLQEYLK